MKKLLFIDRDGCIIQEPADEQVDSLDKFAFLPGVISALGKIVRELDYECVMVTNQDGLGTASFPEETFWPVQNLMLQILAGEGVKWKEICIDRTFAHEGAPTRKPGTAMLTHYLKGDYDLANSWVIGDRETDVQLARNLGAKAIFISDRKDYPADCVTQDWNEIYLLLKNQPRIGKVHRATAETEIEVEVNLDGTGKADIQTGIGFFDHMLHQIARHGGIDLRIQVSGDLHVDEHHTVEDTALALGAAIHEALGSRKGIGRYGFLLPMDDALAQVALDFGGRPWLVWKAEFRREKVGDLPTELFSHFFKSLSDTARCNVNIQAEGENEHHKIEAIFKGFARALAQCIARTTSSDLPTTKGVL